MSMMLQYSIWMHLTRTAVFLVFVELVIAIHNLAWRLSPKKVGHRLREGFPEGKSRLVSWLLLRFHLDAQKA